jgi:hypothetical protein
MRSLSWLSYPSRGRESINKVFLCVTRLLGGLLALGSGCLLLLGRGSALGGGLSLGRGPEGLMKECRLACEYLFCCTTINLRGCHGGAA